MEYKCLCFCTIVRVLIIVGYQVGDDFLVV